MRHLPEDEPSAHAKLFQTWLVVSIRHPWLDTQCIWGLPVSFSFERVRELHHSDDLPLRLRGKNFGLSELRVVFDCVRSYWGEGRTQISKEICKELDWRQPNGWLKDRACRDVLLRLEEMGIIGLPPRMSPGATGVTKAAADVDLEPWLPDSPVTGKPQGLEFELAKGGKTEEVWNTLVEEYHYLGYTVMVGRSLKYLIKKNGQLCAAICFVSPAWKLSPRDRALDRLGISGHRDRVVNNARFLVLPQAEVPNLASAVLSKASQQVGSDWAEYYSIDPLVAETFVDPYHFDGACYKAANWVHVGKTEGYAKIGSEHHNSRRPKSVFLYGLTRTVRRKLLRYYA